MAKPALITALLAGTALAASFSHAVAQTQPSSSSSTSATATSDTTTPTSSRTTVEEVIVQGIAHKATGGGLLKPQVATKAISTVSSAYIQTQASIQNAYQYVALTPGALVSTTDPYGLNEQYSINIHGLGQDELGYVLEGMPLNDIGYYSAYPSQFIDSENFDEISLAQGTADLDSPVISAAGGLMTMTMLDPSLHPGGLMDVGYGSYNTDREFIRLDSGFLGDTGVRAFVSFSHTAGDNWHGPGRGERYHVDFKFVKEWGENRIAWSGEWHNAVTPLYIQPTLDNFDQFGAKGAVNNYAATFMPNDAAAGTDYYLLHAGTFRIFYTSAPSRFKLASNVTLNVTPYWQYGYGSGPYGTTLTETGNIEGAPGWQGPPPYSFTNVGPTNINIPNYAEDGGTATNGVAVMANYTDLQYRAGVVTKVTYDMGPNSVVAGVWEDYSDETDTQSFSALTPSGRPVNNIWADGKTGFVTLPDGQLFLAGQDHVITKTTEPFVADILHLLDDKLTIEVGLKYAIVSRGGTNGVPGPQYDVVINNNEPLPRAAVRYQFDAENQVYANISTNFRTPSEATFFNEYYEGYQYATANTNLKPEYSTSEDVGYRYSGHFLTASATLFNFYFTNRQESSELGGSGQLLQESINVGSQTTYGLDLEAGTRPWNHISPYVSAEFLHSVEDNNFAIADPNTNVTTYLPTAGKTSIRSPEFQAALGLSYDDGTFFGNFNVKYVASQYSTFMDDQKIPGYAIANLGAGVRLPSDGLKARPEIKLNIINLTGQNYLSSVASPTPNAQPQTAHDGSTISGASPTYYLSGGLAVVLTATQAF